MRKLSRRTFLKGLIVGVGTVASVLAIHDRFFDGRKEILEEIRASREVELTPKALPEKEEKVERVPSGKPTPEEVLISYANALRRIHEDAEKTGEVRGEPYLAENRLYGVRWKIVIEEKIAIDDATTRVIN